VSGRFPEEPVSQSEKASTTQSRIPFAAFSKIEKLPIPPMSFSVFLPLFKAVPRFREYLLLYAQVVVQVK
jgi:hypothetical protein